MKIHASSQRPKGFTLIELLLVITIIAILASLVGVGAQIAATKAKQLKVKNDLADLENGIGRYRMEKSRLPLPPDIRSEEPIPLSEGNGVLQVLMGTNLEGLNPAETIFISPRPGSNGAGGLVGDRGHYGYLDPWGEPYRLILDSNLDSRIKNPDRSNDDPGIVAKADSEEIITNAIAFSCGPDRKPGTKDDIVTWR